MDFHARGLTTIEAELRLGKYGKNILPRKKPVGTLILLLEQMRSPLIYILLGAAIISLLLADYKDAVVILATVLINTLLGFYQESKAQRSLNLLRSMLTLQARVVRSGVTQVVNSELVVPGDVVLLAAGERVPADGYVVKASNLKINEAVLTGESAHVSKQVASGAETKNSNQLVFMGATVVGGRGVYIVTKTGFYSEFGKIAVNLSRTHEEKTPLQKKISQFARFLSIVIGSLSIILFCAGILLGQSFVEMFTISVALAVAAIPEGMTVSLTVILAIGMQRILKRKALVRKLLAAEALGSTTVIATDKTGTLTYGTMSVVKTKFVNNDLAYKVLVLSNDREDPLEFAIWEYMEKQKLNPEELAEKYVRTTEIPFDSVNKFSASLYAEDTHDIIYIKGAPEELLRRSKLDKKQRDEWLSHLDQWGADGLRIVGIGYKKLTKEHAKGTLMQQIRDIEWLGLVGISDPVRETVKDSFKLAREAGITIKVITGDYTATSMAVLRKLDIFPHNSEILEGEMLDSLSDEELDRCINKTVLFSRVSPLQKLRIVETLKKNGEVVALLGDGVNDAPAIKAANIGIVVGAATDVAKETADMVLLDSDFGTIIAAIEEGRGMYRNIRKVLLYLLTGSFSEIVLVMFTLALGFPLSISASQILWINMVADTFPNLALTVEPKERNLLKAKPADPKSQFLDGRMRLFIFIISCTTGLALFFVFYISYMRALDLEYARTIVFMALGLTSLLYVFSVRNLNKFVIGRGLLINKWLLFSVFLGILIQLLPLSNHLLGQFLGISTIDTFGWVLILAAPIFVIAVVEAAKYFFVWGRRSLRESV